VSGLPVRHGRPERRRIGRRAVRRFELEGEARHSVLLVIGWLEQRGTLTGPDDFVFVGEHGAPIDGSALRRRYDPA
jgi:hypothetical protein